jgi:hypothetical protein
VNVTVRTRFYKEGSPEAEHFITSELISPEVAQEIIVTVVPIVEMTPRLTSPP